MWRGVCTGPSAHLIGGRRRLGFHVDGLARCIAVPEEEIVRHPAPVGPGRYDAAWLRELLEEEPAGCLEVGLHVKVYTVPPCLEGDLAAWEGHSVGAVPRPLGSGQCQRLAVEFTELIPTHARGGPDVAEPGGSEPAEAGLGLDLHLRRRSAALPSTGPSSPEQHTDD
eukprot:1421232-Lingulodinium_polyedra.AAC.1